MTLAIRGDVTRMGYENSDVGAGDPYGTALDLTSYTEARICAEVTPNFTADEAEFRRVGCGAQAGFPTDCQLETFEYRVSLTGDAGYQNGYDRILAQFFGESSAPVEQTAGAGDYLHILSFASPSNQHFGTFAYETSDDDVIELVSTYTESITITMDEVGQPVDYTAVLVSSDAECDVGAAVNNNADLQSLSFVNDEKFVAGCDDSFLIKAMLDDGTDVALANPADLVPITAFEIDMERPLETVNEMTGGDCNAPTEAGPITGTLTITFKEHTDNSNLSYLAWKAGTFYQASITLTGSVINNPLAGLNRRHVFRFPKLCLVEAPDYNVVDPGKNPYTLVFRILDSNNVIPGFTGNSPEAEFVNERVGEYLLT